MKVQTIIVLTAILVSALLPASLPYLALSNDDHAIGALDVCHSATPALSSGGEMPFLNECACNPVPATVVAFFATSTSLFSQTLFTFRNERPPIV